MRWRMAIEEFMPAIKYVPGEKNIIADALSRLPMEQSHYQDAMEDLFDLHEGYKYIAPITFKTLAKEQDMDTFVKKLKRETPDRLGSLFEDIGKRNGSDEVTTIRDPVTKQERIIVPKSLQNRLMQWYHTMLVHPGSDRLFNTLHQHYTWPNMRAAIAKYVKHCDACQRAKRGQRGYGKVSPKDPETEPWKDVAVDLSGPWKAKINHNIVNFFALTMIDVFTSWVEIIPIHVKTGQNIRDLIEQKWLRRYPRPSRIIFDAGSEFDNQWFYVLMRKWHIKPEPITIKNPRANAIIE